MSVILGVCAVFGAYWALSPSVWSRETFDLLPLGAAFAAGGNLGHEVSMSRSKAHHPDSWRVWLGWQIFESIGYAAALVVIAVVLAEGGPSSVLQTSEQRVWLGLSCVLSVALFLWLWISTKLHRTRMNAQADLRLEHVREEARRNVDEFVRGLEGSRPGDVARQPDTD